VTEKCLDQSWCLLDLIFCLKPKVNLRSDSAHYRLIGLEVNVQRICFIHGPRQYSLIERGLLYFKSRLGPPNDVLLQEGEDKR